MSSTPTTRFRARQPLQKGLLVTTNQGRWPNGPIDWETTSTDPGTQGFTYESVTSEGHPGPPYLTGGDFLVKRYELSRSIRHYHTDTGWFPNGNQEVRQSADGIIWGDFTSAGLPNEFSYNLASQKFDNVTLPSVDLLTYSAQAMNKLNPLQPGVNLAQSLVELMREGIPSLPLRLLKRTKDLRDLGGEYLNIQFGWKPLLSDLQDLYDTWKKVDSMLAQIIRDNNRPVRRRATLLKEKIVTPIEDLVTGYPFPSHCFYGGSITNGTPPGRRTVQEIRHTRVWCVGRGKYYIPDVTDDRWTKKTKEALFGLRPTPALLYELMPWSWLVDYFSNVGEVVNQYFGNGLEDFVFDYAYLMRHSRKERLYQMKTHRLTTYRGVPVRQMDFSAREVWETKERVEATHFGFGLKLDGLSPRQLAILGALGLSKSKFRK